MQQAHLTETSHWIRYVWHWYYPYVYSVDSAAALRPAWSGSSSEVQLSLRMLHVIDSMMSSHCTVNQFE